MPSLETSIRRCNLWMDWSGRIVVTNDGILLMNRPVWSGSFGKPFHSQYLKANSPNWWPYIFFVGCYWEFGVRSKQNAIVDTFLNSHYLSAWQCIRVGHLILRALAIRVSNPQNALIRISFHSPKSLPHPVTPKILVIFYFYCLV